MPYEDPQQVQSLRREKPLEEQIQPKKHKDKSTNYQEAKRKNFELEKWKVASKDTNDMKSSSDHRSSLTSEGANKKALDIISGSHFKTIRNEKLYNRHSDNLYLNNNQFSKYFTS
jgi:hypothetical protein